MAYIPQGNPINVKLLNEIDSLTVPLMRYLKSGDGVEFVTKYNLIFSDLDSAVAQRKKYTGKIWVTIVFFVLLPIFLFVALISAPLMIFGYSIPSWYASGYVDIVLVSFVVFMIFGTSFRMRNFKKAAGLYITIKALEYDKTLEKAVVCDKNFFKFYKFVTSNYSSTQLSEILSPYTGPTTTDMKLKNESHSKGTKKTKSIKTKKTDSAISL